MDKIKSQEEVTALESQRADSRSAIQQSARGNGVNNKSDDDQMQPLRGNIHWRRENDDNDLHARYGTIYSYSHLLIISIYSSSACNQNIGVPATSKLW
ncbi:hypothetical protein ACHAXH_004372 [Discostella pseudostelligera]